MSFPPPTPRPRARVGRVCPSIPWGAWRQSLYNLAPDVADQQFQEYADNEKGPYIDSLPSIDEHRAFTAKMARFTSELHVTFGKQIHWRPCGGPAEGDGATQRTAGQSGERGIDYDSRVTLREAYKILGVPPEATAAQVKAAYRRLVAEAHPDRGGQTAEFVRIRAAYEIVSAFLEQGLPDDEIPVPDGLRAVIDSIVNDFREQQRWAEAETMAALDRFESYMAARIAKASRGELRGFSDTFSAAWDAVVGELFGACNSRCDAVLQRYEVWYAKNTQALFDGMYRRDLARFARNRGFWQVFAILVAMAAALSVAIGWEGPWRRWVSLGMIIAAAGLAFLTHWWQARRRRKTRETVEPLSVVVFALDKDSRFPTETTLRRGRLTTAALGLAGLFLGNAASGGLAVPVLGAIAGSALGGALDRFIHPLDRMRAGMRRDLQRFMGVARTQMAAYVIEAHSVLLDQVRTEIARSYRERVQETVRLLAAGGEAAHRPPD